MSLTIFIAAVVGLLVGASGCYFWRESQLRQQLAEVLKVMQPADYREDISLPMLSQLRRRASISKQQQHQLEEQLFSWQSVLQEAPIGYLQVDAQNQVLWCNQTAQNLLQIQKWHSARARLLLELVRSYELDRFIEKTRSTQVANELVWQFHCGYHEAANSRFSKGEAPPTIWLKARSMLLADGVIGVFIESQQERVETAAARERWLGDLVHEIRTPLTVIHLLAETLQSKVTPDLTRWTDRVLQETNRSIDLVQHFLELSKLETSATAYLRLVRVDLVQLLHDVWDTLEPIATQRDIQFVYQGPSQIVLDLDLDRFTQVAINLFDNSLKYCPDPGHIWVDIRVVAPNPPVEIGNDEALNRVEIDLYDDGSGFSPKDLPYIFERLYRGDLSRQRQPSDKNPRDSRTTGSGLGLAIVRQIILAHQGTIVADNHPTTGGAWFHIVLDRVAVQDR